MKKALILFWGALTLIPFIYLPYFLRVREQIRSATVTTEAGAIFDATFPLHVGIVVLELILLVSYVVYLAKSARVPEGRKGFWFVVLILTNAIALPVFWYLYVWRPATVRKIGMTGRGDR